MKPLRAQSDQRAQAEIEYPMSRVLYFYFVTGGVTILIIYLAGYIRWPGIILSAFIWTAFYYLTNMFRYKIVFLFDDRIVINRPLALYSKKLEYLFEDLELIFFQPHGAYYSDPYFKLFFKNGKKMRVRFPQLELGQSKYHFKSIGIKLKTARYKGDSPYR